MKIVHIGDSHTGGGAAHAMSRLHQSLRRRGVHSHLLVRDASARERGIETVATRGDADDLFPAVRETIVRHYVELNRTDVTNTHFSLYLDGADLSEHPLVESSDVVHLHWTASFQTPADVRALMDVKPVVWTLHDLGPLTGGCHFSAGCERYRDGCHDCPQLARDPFALTARTLRDKQTLWRAGRPTFIAPSHDIAQLARQSAVARDAEASIVHIPHGIDTAAFRPQSKEAARAALGIPVEGRYVLCGSNYNAETRKGLRLLDRVVAAASAELGPGEPAILTVGEPKLDLRGLDGLRVVQLGRVPADTMPLVYAAADVFLSLSLEDNFPCMLLESLSCGTPVIAFDAGGIREIVRDGTCGRIVPPGDQNAMAAALSALLRDGEELQRASEDARAHVEDHFDDASLARRHAELYEQVAAHRGVRPAHAGPSRASALEEILPRLSTACLLESGAEERERAAALAAVDEAKSGQIAALAAVSDAKSQQIAALERAVEQLRLDVAAQSRQVQEKDAALSASHDALARLQATLDEQRDEIELIHRIAADRESLIERLHLVAEERAAVIDQLASADQGNAVS